MDLQTGGPYSEEIVSVVPIFYNSSSVCCPFRVLIDGIPRSLKQDTLFTSSPPSSSGLSALLCCLKPVMISFGGFFNVRGEALHFISIDNLVPI